MDQWDDVVELLTAMADDDLRANPEMSAPCLLAFGGAELHFAAFLRPFRKGAYHDPLIELLALAAPLDSDRLAFAASARAWSLEDPVPPVTEGADLRQRVLSITLVDGTGPVVEHTSVLVPFEQSGPGGGVGWGQPRDLGASEGWISAVLQQTVGRSFRSRMVCTDAAVGAQADRVERLGHTLFLAPAIATRCGRSPLIGPQQRR